MPLVRTELTRFARASLNFNSCTLFTTSLPVIQIHDYLSVTFWFSFYNHLEIKVTSFILYFTSLTLLFTSLTSLTLLFTGLARVFTLGNTFPIDPRGLGLRVGNHKNNPDGSLPRETMMKIFKLINFMLFHKRFLHFGMIFVIP